MKKTMFVILIGLLALQLRAQYNTPSQLKATGDDEPMTLLECVTRAVEKNPSLQSARMEEQANEYQIKEIKAQGLPQVSASGRYTFNYALPEQLLPGEVFGQPGTTVPVKFGVANNITGGVELQQLLFSKSYFTGLKAAEASQSMVRLQTFKTTEDLVYSVAQTYLQLQISQRQREILNANLDRINQLIDMAKIQFEEGLIKKVDVDQLLVNRTNLRMERQNLEIGITQQLNLLKFYMGMNPDEEVLIAEDVQEGNLFEFSEELILAQNTNLQLLDKQLQLSELEIENIEAGYYPNLAAFAQYGWQGQTDKLFSSENQYDINGTTTGALGLSLNIPIFDGFRKRNQLQQARISQDQLLLNRMYTTNSIRMEFANANENLRQNKTLLDTQKENMQLAEELFEVAQLSYQEGVAPLTELLNAETSLKEAQTQYLTALLQLNLAEIDYMKSSGQMAKFIQENLK